MWTREEFVDNAKVHIHSLRALGIEERPKHHALLHMCDLIRDNGTPHLWANWRDESENQDLKRIGLHAHRMVWHHRLLTQHRCAYGNRSKRQQKRQRFE